MVYWPLTQQQMTDSHTRCPGHDLTEEDPVPAVVPVPDVHRVRRGDESPATRALHHHLANQQEPLPPHQQARLRGPPRL